MAKATRTRGRYVLLTVPVDQLKADQSTRKARKAFDQAAGRIFQAWCVMGCPAGEFLIEFCTRERGEGEDAAGRICPRCRHYVDSMNRCEEPDICPFVGATEDFVHKYLTTISAEERERMVAERDRGKGDG